MKRHFVILPLATAVAALATTSRKSEAAASPMPPEPGAQERAEAATRPADQKPNVIFSSGEDLLGLIVTRAADGTVLAQHYSHYSHSSHSSHYSHYSSGF
jgi:hypothetical protein